MGFAPSAPAMRPFGSTADLDLDFSDPDRPGLVTRLLAQCDGRCDPDFWWSHSVAMRTSALLRLVALTEARDDISLDARCAAVDCGEAFEFDLPLQTLFVEAGGDDLISLALGAERMVLIRRPMGEDLRRWRDAQPSSRSAAVRLMLDSLVISGQTGPADEAVLSRTIAAFDPLVAFSVTCHCPACGARNEIDVDLETLALARLAIRQRVLFQEVHRIASRYGWTESEVLAVPPARRARYLELIEDER